MSKQAVLSPNAMRYQLREIYAELARVEEQHEALSSLIRSLEVMLRYAHERIEQTIQWVPLAEGQSAEETK